ncbi:MAG TPA: TGS domain-containing protein [Thermomicrobiales bacterium]|jgi:(p)ppGpp synthase/HD superfamily hydrolase
MSDVLLVFDVAVGESCRGESGRRIREQTRAAVSTLESWCLPSAACEALMLARLLEHDAALGERFGRGLDPSPVALAERLVEWRAIMSAGDGPSAEPTASQLATWLAAIYRAAYLDLPQLTFILTLVADQDARLIHGPPPSRWQAAVIEGVLVPLLELLGMWVMRQRWLDLTAPVLAPVAYARVAAVLGDPDYAEDEQDKRNPRVAAAAYLAFKADLAQRLAMAGIRPRPRIRRIEWRPGATLRTVGRPDWTIKQWRERLANRLGVRIICWSVEDCYRVLGVVHGLGKPIAAGSGQPFSGGASLRFDDPIAVPERNGYRALHTAILFRGPGGRELPVGVRIVTTSMMRLNGYGVTSTFGARATDREEVPTWWNRHGALSRLSNCRAVAMRDDVLALVREQEIGSCSHPLYAFTPDGDVVLLDRFREPPTALDFAYKVHTDLGHRANLIEVDGESVPLHHPLRNGNLVRVHIDPFSPGPDLSWLRKVATAYGKEELRRELTRRAASVHPARVEIEDSLIRTCRLYWHKGYEIDVTTGALDAFVDRITTVRNYPNSDALYDAVSNRRVLPQNLTDRLISEELASVVFGNRPPYAIHRIHFCNVCRPIPTEELRAYERRAGRGAKGLTVHAPGCRLIPTGKEPVAFSRSQDDGDRGAMSHFQVYARDRNHLLGDILQIFYDESSEGVSLHSVHAKTVGDGKADIRLIVRTAGNGRQVARLQRRVQRVRDVAQVFPHPVTAGERSQIGSTPATDANPYTLETVYESPPFCSREDEIETVLSWLESNGPWAPWLLHGQRRVGKSSLVRHLANVALPRFGGVVPVVVDFHDLTAANYSMRGIAGLILGETFRALGKRPPPFDRDIGAVHWLIDSMDTALALAKRRRIVFMIDEFNVLLDLEHDGVIAGSVFCNLRSIVERVRNVHWLFVVQDVHYRDPRRWGSAGDLFQIAQPLEVPHLDSYAAQKLVREPAQGIGIFFENPIPREIYDLTDGNPFYIQAICHRVVADLQAPRPTLVRQEDVDRAVNYVLGNPETFFNHFLVSLDQERRHVLKAIALTSEPGGWVDVGDVVSHLGSARITRLENSVLSTMERLARLGMLELDHGEMAARGRIPIPLLHRWLLRPSSLAGGHDTM